jgi:amidase
MYMAGAMTRSIEDLKLWLSIVEGSDGRSWSVPPVPSEVIEDRSLKDYRIAWTDCFGAVPASAETRATLEQVAKRLSDQHCIVEKQNPPNFDFAAALETLGNLIGAWASTRPIPKRPTLRDDLRRLISGGTLIKSVLRGTRFSLKQYGAALVERDPKTSQLEQFLSQWDAWLCPTVAFPAFPHQPMGKSFEIEGQSINYLLGGVNYTGLFTLTGHPVVVVPIGQTKAGLPIAIQIVGKRWHERSVLAFAGKLTDMIGGWQCPPGY